MIRLEPVSASHSGVVALITELDAYQIGLYGPENCHFVPLSALDQPHIQLLGAFEGDVAVGVGGAKFRGDYVEIIRMFVDTAHRKKGIAPLLMRGLEGLALEKDIAQMYLETGFKQYGAHRLYARMGYEVCGPFGEYEVHPVSVFMGRKLAR